MLEALSFFLVRVPEREAEDDKTERPAFTIFPRYHQSRLVRRVAEDITAHFAATGDIGKKYLADHSAGSGKTLSICWLADRLHSLYKPGTNEKLVDITFILTDRKSLDTNIREDIEKFTHLKDVVGIAKKADDLPRFLKERKPIIVTTQQKFAWVLEELKKNPALKNLRVAFLIDEAHRSQEGQMGAAIRLPFRKADEPDADAPEQDPEEQIAKVIREHDGNQLFVAFTATPAPATVSLFGEPFDSYTEAEAIAEGYIVDVAASIISYKTLYNLHCHFVPPPDEEEKVYPKGVVSKALMNVAFQDDGLIQYKAEVMLRIFEENVMPLIEGRAKAMIVTSSRVAGLRYFNIIKEKLKERGATYKVLYAFSDFTHPETNAEIHEHAVNELKDGELIEERFEGEDYRLMVVANKFQTGFDQPLLAGMFLDKPVVDRNAVQTVSRLNRCHEGKKDVVVVDFTNNAAAILKAFQKYRKGTPFEPEEPDQELCPKLYAEILAAGVFTQKDAADFVKLVATGTDAQVQFVINAPARRGFRRSLRDPEERKAFVYLLARFVKSFHFLTCFFTYPPEIKEFATFAEYVGPQLIKQGSVSDLMKQIRQTEVIKAAVEYQGVTTSAGPVKLQPGKGKKGTGPPPKKVSVQDMIAEIRAKFDISDEEALYIKQVTEEKAADPAIRTTVHAHREDRCLSRRRISRTGQRRDSDGLRRAGTLRGIGRSQIHGHRRHLRHHGRDRDPNPPVIRRMNAMSKTIRPNPRSTTGPREKLLRKGAQALERSGIVGGSVGQGHARHGRDDARRQAGAGSSTKKGWTCGPKTSRQFEGVGDAKATLILAAIEFARRRIKPEGAKIENAGGSAPLDSTFCRPQARAFSLRHHQRGQRSSQCPGRVHWADRPQPSSSA